MKKFFSIFIRKDKKFEEFKQPWQQNMELSFTCNEFRIPVEGGELNNVYRLHKNVVDCRMTTDSKTSLELCICQW